MPLGNQCFFQLISGLLHYLLAWRNSSFSYFHSHTRAVLYELTSMHLSPDIWEDLNLVNNTTGFIKSFWLIATPWKLPLFSWWDFSPGLLCLEGLTLVKLFLSMKKRKLKSSTLPTYIGVTITKSWGMEWKCLRETSWANIV